MADWSKRLFRQHDVFICTELLENGNSVLYVPTLKQLIEVKDTLVQKLLTCEKVLDQKLEKLSPQLYETFLSEFESAILPRKVHKQTLTIFPLSVGLTRDCSLRCIYCHVKAGEKKEEIDHEILTSALEYASQEIKEKELRGLHVSFAVGGEPTYRWDLFHHFVDMVNECASSLNVKLRKSITTNGFYSEQVRKFLVSEFDSILLSFDGPREIQNTHRPAKSGQGSYSIVSKSAKYFAENAKSFNVRATISSLSVHVMKDLVQFFYDNLGPKTDVVLEPLVKIGRAKDMKVARPPSEMDFARNLWKAHLLGLKLGMKVINSGFNTNRIVRSFCHAMTMPSFTVTINGCVTACERDADGSDYSYGVFSEAKKTFEINPNKLHENARLAEMPNECLDCVCKWHCAGDCPDIRRLGYNRCKSNEWLLEQELSRKLDSKNNLKVGV